MRKLSLYYFFYYLAASSFGPYISIYLSEKGISLISIGLILSMLSLTGILAQPIMGILNDRLSDPRRIVLLCLLFMPLFAFGYYYFDTVFALCLVSFFYAMFQSSSAPLSDVLTVEIANSQGFSFGSIRLWGALSFALGSFITGFVYGKIGYGASFISYALLMVLALVTFYTVPYKAVTRAKVSLKQHASQILKHQSFLTFVLFSFLIATSIAINFNFLPIYFKEAGFDKGWIGAAYSIAAIIEVPMFWFAVKLHRRFGLIPMMMLAALCYSLKCLVMAFSTQVGLVLAVQLFDGIAFAFMASASVEVINRYAPSYAKATYQTLFVALTSGIGGIIGSALGGVVIAHWGVNGLYLLMFSLCFIALAGFTARRRQLEPRSDGPVNQEGEMIPS